MQLSLAGNQPDPILHLTYERILPSVSDFARFSRSSYPIFVVSCDCLRLEMGRIDSEKDLERGDDSKVVDEKRREFFVSQQSSPTLTQGTFETDGDAKGMQCDLATELKEGNETDS